MHFTLQRLMRARKRPKFGASNMSLRKLMELEKNPSVPDFHKALAAIRTHYGLDPNLDELFWVSLHNFGKMDPLPTPDLAPFLTKLVVTRKLDKNQIAIVGDVAYKSNILDDLPEKFTIDYIKSLDHNAFRAIELVKRYKLPHYLLVKLYLKADKFTAAESLAQQNVINDGIVVDFIVAYARTQDQASVDRWMSKLTAPSPEHLGKIKHFLLLYNMEANGAHFNIERRPKLEAQKDIQLVTAINQLVVKYPHVLEGETYQKWAQLLLGNLEVLPDLIDEIAADLGPDDLGAVLRFAPLCVTLKLVESMNYNHRYPNMTPIDWCVVLNKLDKTGHHHDINLMFEQIRYSQCLHDPKVVSALCRLQPAGLIDAVLGLKTTPNDYQLLSCWKASPTQPQAAQLEKWPAAPSFAFLRAVACTYYRHNDFVAIARWMRKYLDDYGFELPDQFLQDLKSILLGESVSPKKLGAPSTGTQDWRSCVERVFPPWIDVEWVLARL